MIGFIRVLHIVVPYRLEPPWLPRFHYFGFSFVSVELLHFSGYLSSCTFLYFSVLANHRQVQGRKGCDLIGTRISCNQGGGG